MAITSHLIADGLIHSPNQITPVGISTSNIKVKEKLCRNGVLKLASHKKLFGID